MDGARGDSARRQSTHQEMCYRNGGMIGGMRCVTLSHAAIMVSKKGKKALCCKWGMSNAVRPRRCLPLHT